MSCFSTILLWAFSWIAGTGIILGQSTSAKKQGLDFELGMLQQMGHSTPINYELAMVALGWRGPEHFSFGLSLGHRLVVRPRCQFGLIKVVNGPESYFATLAIGPLIEWQLNDRVVLFGEAGGGVALTDSRDVVGGQGQDFLLNWHGRIGLRWALSVENSWMMSISPSFLHLSNGGQTDPNPGIDAYGATIGISRSF